MTCFAFCWLSTPRATSELAWRHLARRQTGSARAGTLSSPATQPATTSWVRFHVTGFCSACDAPKLPLVSHCRACNACIPRYEQYCLRLSCCIGLRNRKTVLPFLFYRLLCCTYVYILTSFLVRILSVRRLSERRFPAGFLYSLLPPFSYLAAIFAGYSLFAMVCGQAQLVIPTRRPVECMRDDPPRYLRGARLGGPTPSLSLVVVDGDRRWPAVRRFDEETLRGGSRVGDFIVSLCIM
jgi:DHHC palmitoyltransferase